jgi:hypothetical protein
LVVPVVAEGRWGESLRLASSPDLKDTLYQSSGQGTAQWRRSSTNTTVSFPWAWIGAIRINPDEWPTLCRAFRGYFLNCIEGFRICLGYANATGSKERALEQVEKARDTRLTTKAPASSLREAISVLSVPRHWNTTSTHKKPYRASLEQSSGSDSSPF